MKISALVDKVEPFRFEFDGEVLIGEYYKWRTTTPSYAKAAAAQIPAKLEEGTEEEKAANLKARNEAAERVGEKAFLADTIKSWDAEDGEGNLVAPSLEVLEQLPMEFTNKLIAFFDDLRSPNPNPPTASPSS